LDELTSGDLVATLAKIVTGETQIEAHSLQQAFAEANASLRQANTLIGDYTIVADDSEPLPALEVIPQRPGLQNGSPFTVGNGHSGNGATRQPSLFSGGQAKRNGGAAVNGAPVNGAAASNGSHTHREPEPPPAPDLPKAKPPVPRPRLSWGRPG
jgi:hypothetical protein